MDDIGYLKAFFGLCIAAVVLWAPIFAFAYSRRQFGGSSRPYWIGFLAASSATIIFFVGLTLGEQSA